ncbi:DUF3857 domain-containing protein [Pedobacter frigoris]|uniref:DUF3857 domain-containing protein n=1 Tax=Pedobacter frigoris TaxID=2571272 RepID=A0A4U1CMG7_9SPHI|nr:DUF3857 domain-containing protein [Pedobacter frigoris]TKC09061.1 DUF3857 domain-containing protein [Pedobacter frigoris]
MKRLLLFVLTVPTFNSVYAQGIYDVSKIPADLTKNASVVIRNEQQTYEVKSPGSASLDYKTAMTILNKNGEDASIMREFYDKFSSVSSLKATLYDGSGNKIKDYKSSDFKDRSAVSDGSIYEDSRIKYLEFLHTSYPYTIEFSYSVSYNGVRSYPMWYPASSWGHSIEQSKFTFIIPETMTFKYLKSKGLATDSLKTKGKTEYNWSCKNISALEYEPMSTGLRNVLPWVTVAPNQFEYDNAKANIENWKNLGTFMQDLSKGLQVLPEATKAKVQAIIKDAKTPEEKIKLLYKFLQANTRYVSVQLGIGGYRPIAAEKVANVSYGDCKALSNYMKAMLEEAGIKSHLVVIGNDMPSLNKNFASMNQANHMILCLPLQKDTTWLECTSQYVPAGYIGYNNSDRTVLLVTDEGGRLAQTPVYKPADNYQKRITKVMLSEDGNADISIDSKYAYAQFESNLGMLLKDPTEQRKTVLNSLSIPNMEISNLSYSQPDKNSAVLDEKIGLKSSQLLTKGADKLFLTLNLLNRQDGVVTPIENRKTYFAVDYSFNDEDEIIYILPKGYKVEFIPKDITIESEFGKYTAKFASKENTIVYTRTKTMTNKKYPPEKYNEFVSFYKKIYQADKQKGILAKID